MKILLDIGHGTLTAEFDVFYDHCDTCATCASKVGPHRSFPGLCAKGAQLIEHAIAVASQDVPKTVRS